MIKKDSVYISSCDFGKGVFANKSFLPGDLILVFKGVNVSCDSPIHGTSLGAKPATDRLQDVYYASVTGGFYKSLLQSECRNNK